MSKKIIGLTRHRNNGLLLLASLYQANQICDEIIVLDDASDDETTLRMLDEISPTPKITLIRNKEWNKGFREPDETKHRQQLLEKARELYGDDIWLYYFDIDEVITHPQLVRFNIQSHWKSVDAFSVRLYDAHATPEDKEPYTGQLKLLNFRKWFCPKYRNIKMFWKNHPDVNFKGVDKREPTLTKGSIVHNCGNCQHYGKALSEEDWENKCDYYIKHFSKRYQNRWKARKGKYIHTESDFGQPLVRWNELRKNP